MSAPTRAVRPVQTPAGRLLSPAEYDAIRSAVDVLVHAGLIALPNRVEADVRTMMMIDSFGSPADAIPSTLH